MIGIVHLIVDMAGIRLPKMAGTKDMVYPDEHSIAVVCASQPVCGGYIAVF